MLGVQTPGSVLPSAEMGTASMEKSMSIRKNIAAGLMVAAHAVAKDQSKERIQKWVRDTRVKVAKAIEPN